MGVSVKKENLNQTILTELSRIHLPVLGRGWLQLPVGKWLIKNSEVSKDEVTQSWLEKMNRLLASGTVALVYRHEDVVDHLAIGAGIMAELPCLEELYLPVAASWRGKEWASKSVIEPMGNVERVNLMTTVRQKDIDRGCEDMGENREFVRTVLRVCKENRPGCLVVLPPGGQRLGVGADFEMDRVLAKVLGRAPVLTYVMAERLVSRHVPFVKYRVSSPGYVWHPREELSDDDNVVGLMSNWVKWNEGVLVKSVVREPLLEK